MNKFQVLNTMRENGDSILTIRGEDPIAATLEFKNKYIQKQRNKRYTMEKSSILMFSWTDNKFRSVEVNSIINIKSMASLLNNKSKEV